MPQCGTAETKKKREMVVAAKRWRDGSGLGVTGHTPVHSVHVYQSSDSIRDRRNSMKLQHAASVTCIL